MVCSCGGMFCWTCVKPIFHGFPHFICKPNTAFVTSMTRTVVIRHKTPKPITQSLDASPKVQEATSQKDDDRPKRYRMSLQQRAKEQNLEGQMRKTSKSLNVLATRIAAQAAKDHRFREEVSLTFTIFNNVLLIMCIYQGQFTRPTNKIINYELENNIKTILYYYYIDCF